MHSTAKPLADLPIIDLGDVVAGRRGSEESAADAIVTAATGSGFFCVAGHGVDSDIIGEMYEITAAFFHLPDDTKRACEPAPGEWAKGLQRHERALGRSQGENGPPDLRESFSMGRPGQARSRSVVTGAGSTFFAPTKWPVELPEMRPAWERYYRAVEGVSKVVLMLFEVGLALPRGWFDATCENHCSPLMANFYPPAPQQRPVGLQRSGPHTDWGSFTLLYQDDHPGGLEILVDGEWRGVTAVPGTFVVNIGDLLARWTNDRWRSTLHRVVIPEMASGPLWRISIPFFHQPAWDAVIDVIPTCVGEGARYEPITSGANWERRYAEALVGTA